MIDKIVYWQRVDSCETCPGALRDHPKGLYRCRHDTEVTFQQNKDMGVPPGCPYRNRPIP